MNPTLRALFDTYVNTTTTTVPMSYEQWLEYHLFKFANTFGLVNYLMVHPS